MRFADLKLFISGEVEQSGSLSGSLPEGRVVQIPPSQPLRAGLITYLFKSSLALIQAILRAFIEMHINKPQILQMGTGL